LALDWLGVIRSSQLLASDQLTGPVHERAQYLEGLYGDLDPDALPSHLAGAASTSTADTTVLPSINRCQHWDYRRTTCSEQYQAFGNSLKAKRKIRE